MRRGVRSLLPELLKKYQVIHLCGKGKLDESLNHTEGYRQFEYIQKELSDLLDAANLVVSRAGANAICELLALHKPNVLIPLSREASRGDQILNAASFEKQGFSYVIEEEKMTGETLMAGIEEVFANQDKYKKAMEGSGQHDAVQKVADIIDKVCQQKM